MKQGFPHWDRPGPTSDVTIPAPPGHRREVVVHGGGLIQIDCMCGWRSLVLPQTEAEKTYDAHLAALGSWCDFCGGLWPLPTEFKCRDFTLDFGTVGLDGKAQVFVYEGNWLACTPCAELILSGEWKRLAERCVETTLGIETGKPFDKRQRTTSFYRRSVAKIQVLHSAFRRARAGL